jgi:hypothetical protein
LAKFKSTRGNPSAKVEALLPPLPVHKHSDARDLVRLHPDKKSYWSDELCFVSVPIKGQKQDTTHLIQENIAEKFLPQGRIARHALALATKPHDIFFLCIVPTQNLHNIWNETNIKACELSQDGWYQSASMKAEGVDGYRIEPARDQDAFPLPKWPTQPLDDLITTDLRAG